MAYEVIIKPAAQRDLDRLPAKEVERITRHMGQLQTEPRPIGVQKLTDLNGYRIRSGRYRILYIVDDKEKRILVYRIKHRKEAYR